MARATAIAIAIAFLLFACASGLAGAQSVSAPIPSNYIVDVGQAVAFNAVVTGANVPFIAKLDNSTATINTITGSSNGLITFSAITSKSGQATFNVVIIDSTPTIFDSATNAITVNPAPSATLLTPSNTVLQPGWAETYNVAISGGTGPFTVDLLTSSNTLVNTISGASDGTITFNSFTPPLGTDSYYVMAWDNGTAPGHFAFNSSTNTVVSESVATATLLTPSNSLLDIGQYVVYNVLVSNGIGPFTVNLILNGNTVNTIVSQSDGMVTFGSVTPPFGSDSYNVVVTDTGNSPAYVFASSSNTIVVSNTLQIAQQPTVSNTLIDIGQSTTFTVIANGGSFPLQGSWFVTSPVSKLPGYDPSTCNVPLSCALWDKQKLSSNVVTLVITPVNSIAIDAIFPMSAEKSPWIESVYPGNTVVGLWSFNAVVIDGATVPQSITSTGNSVTVYGAVNITMSRSCSPCTIQQGSSVTFNGVASGGTGGPFTYQWYERPQNGTYNAISGATSNTYTFKTTNSTALGSWNFTLQVTDHGTTTPFAINSTKGVNSTVAIIKNTSTTTSTTVKTTITTSTSQSGNGGGGSGGGGGNYGPTVSHYTNDTATGVLIYNLSQKNSETITINGTEFNLTENFITPTSAGITINGTSYTLYPNQTTSIGMSGKTFYINMTGLSYLPIIDTVTINIYEGAHPQESVEQQVNIDIINSTSSISVDLNKTSVPYVSFAHGSVLVVLTTQNTTKVATTFNISNVTAIAPPAPANYTKIIAVNMIVASGEVGVNTTIAYPCSIRPGNIEPFVLKNSTWHPISNFKVNTGTCTVKFAIPQDPIVALMYLSGGSGGTPSQLPGPPSVPGPSIIGYIIVAASVVIIFALAAHIVMAHRRRSVPQEESDPYLTKEEVLPPRRPPPSPPQQIKPVQPKPKKFVPLTKRYRDDVPLQSIRDDKN